MSHDRTGSRSTQAEPQLAQALRARLLAFVEPFAQRLATQLDIRLVQTAVDLVQVILTHRHRAFGLLLSELGGFLLSPAQAPAGTKRISNLLHASDWSADDINAFFWQQASQRVRALQQADQPALLIWDGSVWEKPESQANPDWCVLRSAKARRLSRRRKRLTLPHKGAPILVPGLHWEGLVVVGMSGAPTLAQLQWWTTRGAQASSQREVEQQLLERSRQAWGRQVLHVWDRGYGGSDWLQAAFAADVRFVVRWKKGNHLLDSNRDERKASAIGRGKRSMYHRQLRDTRTKQLMKVGVLVSRVSLLGDTQPLWLLIVRLGKGREPWYLLTAEALSTQQDIWQVVLAYARRWQIELVWRYSKSELAMESPRVWQWEVRNKLLLLAALAYAFLLHLLAPALAGLVEMLLRNWCHRSGKRYRQVHAPLYRLRSAISRLWQSVPPPGYHLSLLNSG